MREPEGVTLEDGPKLRHETTFLIMDGGKERVLTLRVGRGVIKDVVAEGGETNAGASRLSEAGPAPESTGEVAADPADCAQPGVGACPEPTPAPRPPLTIFMSTADLTAALEHKAEGRSYAFEANTYAQRIGDHEWLLVAPPDVSGVEILLDREHIIGGIRYGPPQSETNF